MQSGVLLELRGCLLSAGIYKAIFCTLFLSSHSTNRLRVLLGSLLFIGEYCVIRFQQIALLTFRSFCSVFSGALLGLVVRKVRYLKPFIVFGTVLFLAAFGVLINYRGGLGTASHSGIIGSQILLGIAGGLFSYPTQASIQAATMHEHVAVITGLYLATYNIGSAFGNTVSGAIWTQTLIPTLLKNLPSPYNNMTIAQSIYGSPFEYATNYSIGTPLRDGIITSYRYTQKLLTITGICLCVPLIIFSLLIRNPRLGEEQSLPDAEEPIALEDRQPWWRLF